MTEALCSVLSSAICRSTAHFSSGCHRLLDQFISPVENLLPCAYCYYVKRITLRNRYLIHKQNNSTSVDWYELIGIVLNGGAG